MNTDKENVREGEMEMHQCLSQTLDVGKKKTFIYSLILQPTF